jgi:hypothetical protein
MPSKSIGIPGSGRAKRFSRDGTLVMARLLSDVRVISLCYRAVQTVFMLVGRAGGATASVPRARSVSFVVSSPQSAALRGQGSGPPSSWRPSGSAARKARP